MSWDAIIMRFGDAKSINDFPPDFIPPPVTDSATLQETLRRMFPNASHEDERSYLVGDDYWLEFSHGCHTDELGRVSAISIRTNAGSGSIPHIKALCDAFDARLLDIQTSEFADFSTDTESSMNAFSIWRDRALSQRRDEI